MTAPDHRSERSRPARVHLPSPEPDWLIEITDDGSRTLFRSDRQVSYHSGCGAAAECDHVYFANGGCGDDLNGDWPATIFEIGFGTGLAMLRTMDRFADADRSLRYISAELAPLRPETLSRLELGHAMRHPELATRFLDWYPTAADEFCQTRPRTLTWEPSPNRRLELILGDVRDWIEQAEWVADTVYFDPFDPKTNPELWEPDFLRKVVRRMREGGRLVTYCVASEIRRRMETFGLEVRRVPGPTHGKREVMIATLRTTIQ